MPTDRELVLMAEPLHAGARTTVLTGAGVSSASGVPTFRGADGLWRRHRPEDLATPHAFRRDPALIWEWYDWRRQLVAGCEPNRAHAVLAAWTRRDRDMRLITQNVDGLHERAGARRVIRFHGSLWEVGCWEQCPDSPKRWPDLTVPFKTLPPTCSYCGGFLRPGVVWFGEGIDPGALAQSDVATGCDLFLTIGTSSLVHPAAGLIEQARRRGRSLSKSTRSTRWPQTRWTWFSGARRRPCSPPSSIGWRRTEHQPSLRPLAGEAAPSRASSRRFVRHRPATR